MHTRKRNQASPLYTFKFHFMYRGAQATDSASTLPSLVTSACGLISTWHMSRMHIRSSAAMHRHPRSHRHPYRLHHLYRSCHPYYHAAALSTASLAATASIGLHRLPPPSLLRLTPPLQPTAPTTLQPHSTSCAPIDAMRGLPAELRLTAGEHTTSAFISDDTEIGTFRG
eukprot:4605558-Prymnesium_polylepis.1